MIDYKNRTTLLSSTLSPNGQNSISLYYDKYDGVSYIVNTTDDIKIVYGSPVQTDGGSFDVGDVYIPSQIPQPVFSIGAGVVGLSEYTKDSTAISIFYWDDDNGDPTFPANNCYIIPSDLLSSTFGLENGDTIDGIYLPIFSEFNMSAASLDIGVVKLSNGGLNSDAFKSEFLAIDLESKTLTSPEFSGNAVALDNIRTGTLGVSGLVNFWLVEIEPIIIDTTKSLGINIVTLNTAYDHAFSQGINIASIPYDKFGYNIVQVKTALSYGNVVSRVRYPQYNLGAFKFRKRIGVPYVAPTYE